MQLFVGGYGALLRFGPEKTLPPVVRTRSRVTSLYYCVFPTRSEAGWALFAVQRTRCVRE
jgi:hypothetical protein